MNQLLDRRKSYRTDNSALIYAVLNFPLHSSKKVLHFQKPLTHTHKVPACLVTIVLHDMKNILGNKALIDY
ncbi:hypothetical protein RIF29_38493 [Crotalaria pallida]|uniref:Uncharacterized protein n=1 Tax=Crotalaria pallida TaxID=3830 RepID=A0AAN9E2D6_CROPI